MEEAGFFFRHCFILRKGGEGWDFVCLFVCLFVRKGKGWVVWCCSVGILCSVKVGWGVGRGFSIRREMEVMRVS